MTPPRGEEHHNHQGEGSNNDPDNHWFIDKRIQLAIVIPLVVQLFVWVFWGATLQSQVQVNASELAKIDARVYRNEENIQQLRIETTNRLARIEAKLDQQIDEGGSTAPR